MSPGRVHGRNQLICGDEFERGLPSHLASKNDSEEVEFCEAENIGSTSALFCYDGEARMILLASGTFYACHELWLLYLCFCLFRESAEGAS